MKIKTMLAIVFVAAVFMALHALVVQGSIYHFMTLEPLRVRNLYVFLAGGWLLGGLVLIVIVGAVVFVIWHKAGRST